MYNLDEECTVGNKEFCFWHCNKAEYVVFLFLMSETHGILLTLGTAKFKQQNYSCSLFHIYLPFSILDLITYTYNEKMYKKVYNKEMSLKSVILLVNLGVAIPVLVRDC